VFGVGDGITDDRLEERLEDTAGLFVDHGRNTLDTATTSETADGRLGDTLDVVAQDLDFESALSSSRCDQGNSYLAMAFRAAFAEAFAAFST
jgi:hypothetical protein